MPLDPITEILNERGLRYGPFICNAEVAQNLKQVMRATRNWRGLKSDQQEALDVIAAKISRILTGDPDYPDSWNDIAGYAQLVASQL